jgi:hypothetical protein
MSDRTIIPSRFINVTPNDSTPLNGVISLLIGGAGSLVIQGTDGQSATIAVIAGQEVHGKFTRVMAATTATSIVAGMTD